jgi:hypothetical protein
VSQLSLLFDHFSADLFSVDLGATRMSEDGPERRSTDVFRHLDDVAERVFRQPVGTGASHRAHDVLAAPEQKCHFIIFC